MGPMKYIYPGCESDPHARQMWQFVVTVENMYLVPMLYSVTNQGSQGFALQSISCGPKCSYRRPKRSSRDPYGMLHRFQNLCRYMQASSGKKNNR